MLRRIHGYLTHRRAGTEPAETLELESMGCTVVRGLLNDDEVRRLAAAVDGVFTTISRDNRGRGQRPPALDEHFRYEMLNRSDACRRVVAHPRMLSVIEPLLGEDCHVIANTAWRNPPKPNDPAQAWHIDAGPHVPLPAGVEWPADIPHPVFAIGVHIFLQDCTVDDGPTGVLQESHLSGRFPPKNELMNAALTYHGKSARPLVCAAGDAALFVSDVWHRRLPTGAGDNGRFFLQVHYGRRDIAQRIRTTEAVNHLSTEARSSPLSERQRLLFGLHLPSFYDG
jgi:ectoine hydroxylase-related dioxygenase (phytanoyl-CoA dioxygenase family)